MPNVLGCCSRTLIRLVRSARKESFPTSRRNENSFTLLRRSCERGFEDRPRLRNSSSREGLRMYRLAPNRAASALSRCMGGAENHDRYMSAPFAETHLL